MFIVLWLRTAYNFIIGKQHCIRMKDTLKSNVVFKKCLEIEKSNDKGILFDELFFHAMR